MSMLGDIIKQSIGMLGNPGTQAGWGYITALRAGVDPATAMAMLQRANSDNRYTQAQEMRAQAEYIKQQRQLAAEAEAQRKQTATNAVIGAYADPRYQAAVDQNPQVMRSYLSQLGGLEQAQKAGVLADAEAPKVTKIAERIAPNNVKYVTYQDSKGNRWEEPIGEVRPPQSAASVTVNMPPDQSAYLKEQGKQVADWEVKLSEGSTKAQTRLDMLSQIEPLLDSVNTGRLAPGLATVGAALQSVNIDPAAVGIDPKLPATAEAINSVAAELTLAKIGGEGGMPANNFSNADRQFIERTAPQLQNTPIGNRIIIQTARAMAQRQLDKHLAWLQYKGMKEERGEFPSQSTFEMQWITQSRQTPLFPVVSTPDELLRMPKGTIYTAPDGSVRVKQ